MESIADAQRARAEDERRERSADGRRARTIGFGASVGWHSLVFLIAAMWAGEQVLELVPAGRSGPTVFLADSLPPEPPALPGLNPSDPTEDDARLRPTGEPTVTIKGFTFDFHKIAGQSSLLFPFIAPGLSLEHLGIVPRPSTARLQVPSEFLVPDSGSRERGKHPLTLGAAALQAAVDRSWSRRDRWSAFQPIARMTDQYDPTIGQLPALLRGFIEQNGLQLYADPGSKDPRLWAELQLAADHVGFIGFISRYASAHPSTRSTTELLFMLDKMAQAGRDALITLLDIDPDVDLAWTLRSNPDAHEFIVQLRRHYNALLLTKDLTSRDLLIRHYNEQRLAILEAIVRTTPDGYRASDARLLIGALYWREGRKDEAVQTWRVMTANPDDVYFTTASELSAVVRRSSDSQGRLSTGEIDRILSADYARWVSASIDRLQRFGFRIDQY